MATAALSDRRDRVFLCPSVILSFWDQGVYVQKSDDPVLQFQRYRTERFNLE